MITDEIRFDINTYHYTTYVRTENVSLLIIMKK